MESNDISVPIIENDELGNIWRIFVQFEPHYFIDIQPNKYCELTLYMGATHHGFSASAAKENSQLENNINEIRVNHPKLVFD